jgi:hypothetical protein
MPPRKRPTPAPGAQGGRGRRSGLGPLRPATEIDVTAAGGRKGLAIGDRVTIAGTGLYSGDQAVIERFVGSVIPSALVRTTDGHSRQVRTVDLQPAGTPRPDRVTPEA